MRVNLKRARQKGAMVHFIKEMILAFSEEYDFSSDRAAAEYVVTGRQGLYAFVEFIKDKGYQVEPYHLEANRDLHKNVGEDWQNIIRDCPSFGFVIADDCPKWVEFKLRHG